MTKAQEMSVLDLYTVTSTTDIRLTHNFLVNNKGFNYISTNKDNSDANFNTDVYLFSYNTNILTVKISSGMYEGTLKDFSWIIWQIYDQTEYTYFINSLTLFSFEKYEEGKYDNGVEYSYWKGTSGMDVLKGVFISKHSNYYEVGII